MFFFLCVLCRRCCFACWSSLKCFKSFLTDFFLHLKSTICYRSWIDSNRKVYNSKLYWRRWYQSVFFIVSALIGLSQFLFPEFLHGTIKHIEMSHTLIQNVDDETFQGLRLESLKLVNNKLLEFSEKSFRWVSLVSVSTMGAFVAETFRLRNLIQHVVLRNLFRELTTCVQKLLMS